MAKNLKFNKKKFSIISNSPEETIALGKELAKKLHRGSIVCLSGVLGSGKTTFIKGIAKGLRIKQEVISPSFILAKEYPTRSFIHIDLYRITLKEFLQAGLENYISDENICAIEWSEKIKPILNRLIKNKKLIYIKIQLLKNQKRKFTFSNYSRLTTYNSRLTTHAQ